MLTNGTILCVDAFGIQNRIKQRIKLLVRGIYVAPQGIQPAYQRAVNVDRAMVIDQKGTLALVGEFNVLSIRGQIEFDKLPGAATLNSGQA